MDKEKLALYGGKPVREKPLPPMYPGALFIDENEERAVIEVLRSKSLFRYYGPNLLRKAEEFEKRFAEYMGVKYALGVSSGTAALYTALKALGMREGDEVIVPAYGWISVPAMVAATGATPVIAGIDESLSLDPDDIERKITDRTKAILAVHMRGAPCDMDRIMDVAKEHDLMVIEDAAQSCGGEYKGKKLGSIGDIGIFSFQLNKIITAGEGGAVITNNEDFYRRALAVHDVAAYYRAPDYVPPLIGFNFRMSEITAAILIEQLKKIDRIIERMRRNKEKIKKEISDIDGIEFRKLNDPNGDTGICIIFFLPTQKKALEFVRALNAENIGAFVIYREDRLDGHVCKYWLPVLKERMRIDKETMRRALDLLGRAVNIDVNPILTEEDVNSIIEGIHKVANAIL
ncbi:MAG: glutamine--scyllo-inositol aminotransferase [Thermoprotei archaeon]|nr:MAG: glutamine--scyllo-inositol aminotransferase [Thermoprotei archaeon]